jgi:hypothetical protein
VLVTEACDRQASPHRYEHPGKSENVGSAEDPAKAVAPVKGSRWRANGSQFLSSTRAAAPAGNLAIDDPSQLRRGRLERWPESGHGPRMQHRYVVHDHASQGSATRWCRAIKGLRIGRRQRPLTLRLSGNLLVLLFEKLNQYRRARLRASACESLLGAGGTSRSAI